MAELPSGTVTFLFSDIEGSTRLLTRFRGSDAEVLGEHQRLLRAGFAEHDGREVHIWRAVRALRGPVLGVGHLAWRMSAPGAIECGVSRTRPRTS